MNETQWIAPNSLLHADHSDFSVRCVPVLLSPQIRPCIATLIAVTS